MPEYQSPQPGLARHLNPVRLGHVLPELPWDNTLLLCFDHKRPEEGLTYCGFAFGKQGIAQQFTSTPFQGSPLQAVWLNEQENTPWREPQGLPDWAARSAFRLIPLTLFSGPLGFLLLPADLGTVSLNATHWMSLFHLLQDCLVDDLDSTFSSSYLKSIQSREDLVSRFAQHLAAWFAPCHYKIRTLQSPKTIQDQPGAFHGVFQPDHHLVISLDAEPETYELSLEFSSLHYREPEKRINLYREPWFALLKEAHQTQLQRYFKHLLAA